jgi:hypothetical protein
VLSQKKRVSGDATGKGQPAQAMIPALPEEARERLIDDMVGWVGEWFRSRAEVVLEEPWSYGDDLEEVRQQICGSVARDLEFLCGQEMEALIREAYAEAGVTKDTAGSR